MTDEKRKIMVELTQKLIDDKDEPNKGLLELINSNLTTEYETTPEPLREILMFNLTEQALSQKYYEQIFRRFLKMCNYDIKGIKPTVTSELSESSHLFNNRIEDAVSYNEIEEINDEEAGIIKKLTEQKSATGIQKLQLRKYYFDLRIDHTLELKHIEFYFRWDSFSYNKAKLNNAYFEASKSEEDIKNGVIYNTNKTGAELGLHLIYPKLQYIREINDKLGLVNSTFTDVIIPRKKLEDLDQYLSLHRKSLHVLFNLKDQSINPAKLDEKITFRKLLEFVNKIYDSWSGMKIVAEKNTKKYKDEYLTCCEYKHLIPPPPYEITYKRQTKGICSINLDDLHVTGTKITELAIAEPFEFVLMENVQELEQVGEILIPFKKNYNWCSPMYLENDRLGLSQSPPPIIPKKRANY
jgi:hypothetical protein